jgi:translation initiation factor 1 (eIF-1/SUI1)
MKEEKKEEEENKKLAKVFKKKFACSGTAIEHSEYGGD